MKWIALSSFLLASSLSAHADPKWVTAFPNLQFTDKPLVLLFHGAGDAETAFVAEQVGKVWSFPARDSVGAPDRKLVADLTSVVHYEQGETGLIGLAIAPDFDQSHHLFVSYTASDLALIVARYTLKSDGTADLGSRNEVIRVAKRQNFKNHNCGTLVFGPDNLLYIGTGDGGGAGDPLGNAQDLGQLLGKILRIDVSQLPYHVPADNPFVSKSGARREIWAYGLRNPWKFSFDRENGEMWIGDVGQDRFEEIDFGVKGGNYGWKVYEGDTSFDNPNQLPAESFQRPVLTISHDEGKSVTGGNVYRGKRVPELVGAYVFGDYVTGKTWWIKRLIPVGVEKHELPVLPSPSTFGQDAAGETYAVSYEGTIYRLQ